MASSTFAKSTTLFNSKFINQHKISSLSNNNNLSFFNATSTKFIRLSNTTSLPTHLTPKLNITNALDTHTLDHTPVVSSKNIAGHDLKNGSGFKKTRPTILVSEKLGEAGLNVLREFGDVDCLYDLSQEDLCSKISKYDALIVRSGTKVSRDVFEAAEGGLKVVGRAGVGIDNVDLEAATEFGCLVVNAPTANTIAAAEHGIALLTSMARNVAQSDASIKAGKLHQSYPFFFGQM